MVLIHNSQYLISNKYQVICILIHIFISPACNMCMCMFVEILVIPVELIPGQYNNSSENMNTYYV